MTQLRQIEVVIPTSIYNKLQIVSQFDKTPIRDIASQAIQEWMDANYGKRVPGNP